MRLDPKRSPEDWHSYLKHEAERAWGRRRAAAIEPAMTRMAHAIARVAARTPHAESMPGAAPPSAGRRDAGRA